MGPRNAARLIGAMAAASPKCGSSFGLAAAPPSQAAAFL
jgi:hypothetical protein